MDHLWAPWRMEFIRGKREKGCVFCRLPAERDRMRENLVLHIGARAYVVLNRWPYTCGHLMVIPLRHTSDFLSLTAEENAEIALLLQSSLRILEETCRPDGFNLGMNLGHAAGAGIREHLHHHVVPRWVGDNNFLPIIGEGRSIPEYLHETFDQLRPHFRRVDRDGALPSKDFPRRPGKSASSRREVRGSRGSPSSPPDPVRPGEAAEP